MGFFIHEAMFIESGMTGKEDYRLSGLVRSRIWGKPTF